MKIIISCSREAVTYTVDHKLHWDVLTLFFCDTFKDGIDQMHDVYYSICVETLRLG